MNSIHYYLALAEKSVNTRLGQDSIWENILDQGHEAVRQSKHIIDTSLLGNGNLSVTTTQKFCLKSTLPS